MFSGGRPRWPGRCSRSGGGGRGSRRSCTGRRPRHPVCQLSIAGVDSCALRGAERGAGIWARRGHGPEEGNGDAGRSSRAAHCSSVSSLADRSRSSLSSSLALPRFADTHTNSELSPRSVREDLPPPRLAGGLVEDLGVRRGPLRNRGGGSETLSLVDLLDQRLEDLPVVLEGLLVRCNVSMSSVCADCMQGASGRKSQNGRRIAPAEGSYRGCWGVAESLLSLSEACRTSCSRVAEPDRGDRQKLWRFRNVPDGRLQHASKHRQGAGEMRRCSLSLVSIVCTRGDGCRVPRPRCWFLLRSIVGRK